MSDFKQQIILMVLSAVVGGAVGFASTFYFNTQNAEIADLEFKKKILYEFTMNAYNERKSQYGHIAEAKILAINTPSFENIQKLKIAVQKYALIALISNYYSDPMQPQISHVVNKLTELKTDELLDYLKNEMNADLKFMSSNLFFLQKLALTVENPGLVVNWENPPWSSK
ncbi:MAG: hypothetical protein COC24_007110 [Alphaproteobacteria bacterium]|nr:hypothetical protein [Alphaproteobacteria bacterium]